MGFFNAAAKDAQPSHAKPKELLKATIFVIMKIEFLQADEI